MGYHSGSLSRSLSLLRTNFRHLFSGNCDIKHTLRCLVSILEYLWCRVSPQVATRDTLTRTRSCPTPTLVKLKAGTTTTRKNLLISKEEDGGGGGYSCTALLRAPLLTASPSSMLIPLGCSDASFRPITSTSAPYYALHHTLPPLQCYTNRMFSGNLQYPNFYPSKYL